MTAQPTRNIIAPHELDVISGVSALVEDYDVFFLDIWGVLYDGIGIYPTVVPCLTELKAAGKKTCLVSNTPSRAENISERIMTAHGVPLDLYDEVITAGESGFLALRDRYDAFHKGCGDVAYYIGEDNITTTIDELKLATTENPREASFIMNSLIGQSVVDEDAIYKDLDQCRELDLPMICTNPDMVVNVGDQQIPCAGKYAHYYETIGGRVAYHGKPHVPIYEQAANLIGATDKSRIVAIGDSLHTDIQGANNFGIDSVFNLVGIHWEEVRLDHAPTEADIEKVRQIVEKQPHHPTHAMAGFKW
jgi:HAD superfamily hydrolase (TIGR01459 family)